MGGKEGGQGRRRWGRGIERLRENREKRNH